jgi:hypothetical protein
VWRARATHKGEKSVGKKHGRQPSCMKGADGKKVADEPKKG